MGLNQGIVFVFCLATFSLGEGQTLRLNELAEPCTGNFITKDYNGWDLANETINELYYTPLMNKYTALLYSMNAFQTTQFESINEEQLEASCISARRVPGTLNINVTAYNGDESFLIGVAPVTLPTVFRMNVVYPDHTTGSGYGTVALSDSKSYIVFDICFDNGYRGFIVFSNTQQLDENTRNIIVAHMKSLGFQEKNFVHLNYDQCTEKDGVLVTNMENLPKPLKLEVLTYNSILAKKLILPTYVVG